MGDQQAKVSDQEYGWVAGFFDGEGSVLLSVREKAGKNLSPKVQPGCKVQATDESSFEKMHDILFRANLGHHCSWAESRGFTKAGNPWRAAWSINIVGLSRTKAFLEWLTPALSTKKERAELVLGYIARRQQHSDYRTPITEDEWAIIAKMRGMNPGKRPYSVELNRETPGASSDQLAANGRKGAEARWGVTTSFNDRTPGPRKG